jgi:photosystem II stability/assembly factor-like uncharacterized protein
MASKDGGDNFSRVFRGKGSSGKAVYFVAKKRGQILIGTDNGLYVSDTGIKYWRKSTGLPENTAVYRAAFTPDENETVYLAASTGVYRSRDGRGSFKRIFSAGRTESYDTDEEDDIIEEPEQYAGVPRVLLIDRNDPGRIYLGTTTGIFVSPDAGRSWQKKVLPGLDNAAINELIQSKADPDRIFTATDRGFFELALRRNRAFQLYEGLFSNDIRDVACDKVGNFFLATAKGLYTSKEILKPVELTAAYNVYFGDEPSFGEVREAALRYNEISPGKINAWRNQARLKALMPTFQVEYDKSVYGSSTNGTTLVGPRDWGVSLEWDLADFVWSTDQTSIDVRSRLNTQLRIDVLDEVTRLYFEHRRLKLELLSSPPRNEAELTQKQLRLEELTAALDSYTGGYFSRQIKKLK